MRFIPPEKLYPFFSGRNSFLLESVRGPENISRYSFIGFEPYGILKIKDGVSETGVGGEISMSSEKPLQKLKEIFNGYRQRPAKGLPPFQGGAAGLVSYDFVHYLERLPITTVDDLRIPDIHFLLVDRLIAFDHKENRAWVIVCPGARSPEAEYPLMYDEAENALSTIFTRAENVSERDCPCPDSAHAGSKLEIVHNLSKDDYVAMVRKAKEYIAAGDIFQANLSLRVSAFIGDKSPWALYTGLRDINPSPFAGFFDFGDYFIVSSSPERLVRVRDRVIETRPIAGTRPRGKDNTEDEKMRTELLLNEKERAEHIMLIDLERNDLGKVSDYSSVRVDELMTTEDYSHVIHIVSNIKGELLGNKDPLDVIRAVFPGGTITGVPKIRCMEIIDELERVRRGPYTGSMGYIGFSGNMDLNIIIRTFVVRDSYAYVQAGAGIVADSDPEGEYHEALKKAEALIKTLERI